MNIKQFLLIIITLAGQIACYSQGTIIHYDKTQCLAGRQIAFAVNLPKITSSTVVIWNFGDDCGKSPFYKRSDCDVYISGNTPVNHVYNTPGIYRVSLFIQGNETESYSEIVTITSTKINLKTLPDSIKKYINNSGFESYQSCPLTVGQISLAHGWQSPTPATSDYFNSCFTAPDIYDWSLDVPENFAGNTEAYDGQAYSGIATFLIEDTVNTIAPHPLSQYFNYREYIQTEFVDSLIHGHRYIFSLFVHLSGNSRVVTGLGAYISKNQLLSSEPTVLNVSPQYIIGPDNSNTWINLKDTFTSQGGEKYLTIGNFSDDYNTPLIDAFPGRHIVSNYGGYSVIASYYYIDSVEILPLKWDHLERSTIVCSGKSYQDTSVMVEYSIGQVISTTVKSIDFLTFLTQGFLQPLETDTIGTEKKTEQIKTDDLNLICYPNPTYDKVHVKVVNPGKGKFNTYLFDLQGRVIHSETLVSDGSAFEYELNVRDLAEGIYQLKVVNHNHSTGYFKIVKVSSY